MESWGAKYMVRGFTRSPEMDLAFALGVPHLRRLVVGHPDEALRGEALKEKILADYGMDIPAAHASRRVRTMAAFFCGPDGKWRDVVYPAFEDDSVFTATTAAEFIRAHLSKKELGMGRQRDVAFTLEAIVGSDVVLEAITSAFEAKSDEELAEYRNDICDWGSIAGIMLLRTSEAVGDRLTPRLDRIIARGLAKDAQRASIAARLARARHGHEHRGEISFTDLQWWSDAPKDALLAALAKVEIGKWSFAVCPRLAMLGGEPVLDLYLERWGTLKDAGDQTLLVELFGAIDHPKIAVLMNEMANKSKAKKAAKAWLAAAGKAPPKTAKTGSAPAPAPAKVAVPALDPKIILSRLDAAVTGNDWPDFFELNPEDVLLGMRLVGARAGSDWGLAIERLQGDDPETLQARTWIYGSKVKEDIVEQNISFAIEDGEATGPRGPFDLKKVKGKNPKFEVVARAYHAHFGGGLWPKPETTAKLLDLGAEVSLIVVSDAFAHVPLATGKKKQVLPSASKTYISLAEAIATGDGAKFVPGKSNV